MKNKEYIERLREAWEKAPVGARKRVSDSFGYSPRNINDILANGRKDQSVIEQLLLAIKQASKDVLKDVEKQVKAVQSA